MFLLYNCLLSFLAPIWVVWMLVRVNARRDQPNWKERQGNYDLTSRKDHKRIWIHAVSVGEVVAALPILRELRSRLPDHEIVLSVTTSSGHQTARERAEGLFDHLVYAPIDVARFTIMAMQRVQPSVLAIMETELWMNLLWAAKTFDARTMLINGRISDRSFRRSRWIGFFYRALLHNVDRCLMQSETDAERIRALGAREAEVLGNCKFDQAIEGIDADMHSVKTELNINEGSRVVVVGSIRAEEFSLLADAVGQLSHAKDSGEGLRWIIAPRHIERTGELVASLAKNGVGEVALRSKGEHGEILILDTYGELARAYAAADVAVVGGGFAKLGGQNILQPLAHGKPVLHGPHMANFRDVAAQAIEAGASEVCSTPDELATAIRRLLADPAERSKRSSAARTLVHSNLGASARYAAAIVAETERFALDCDTR